MKLGFSACNFPHRSLLTSLDYARTHGFDFVEAMGTAMNWTLKETASRESLTQKLRELPMGLSIHHALPQPDDAAKTEAFRQSVLQIHEWLQENQGVVQILSFDTWVDRLKSLPLLLWVLELFKDMDLPVATEDYPLNAADAETWSEALQYPHFCILSDLAHTNVRLCDTGDQKVWCLRNEGENLPLPPGDNSAEAFANAWRKKPRPVVEVHIHNNDGQHDQHLCLTDGTLDYTTVVPMLKKLGFNGLVNIETSPTIHGIHGEDADRMLLEDRDYWLKLWNALP